MVEVDGEEGTHMAGCIGRLKESDRAQDRFKGIDILTKMCRTNMRASAWPARPQMRQDYFAFGGVDAGLGFPQDVDDPLVVGQVGETPR